MLKTRAFSAAASMAFAAAAFAQPALFTDLGDHSLSSNSGSQPVTLIAANDIQWFRIVLPAVSATDGYVDLWTNGPGTITDTEMGVYTSVGALRASDDDDGPSNGSALSFGDTLPTRPGTVAIAPFTTVGAAYNGRDGVIAAADTYWIAIGRFNVTFGAASWTVTSTNTTAQFDTTLNWNIQLPGAPSNPVGTTVHSPTSGAAGSSFTATCTVTPGTFPPSTGITVSCDASAVGAGTVALLDDGVAPDAAAGDNIFTTTITTSLAAPIGLQTLNYTVADAESRSSGHSANYQIMPPPPANDNCGTPDTAVVGPNAFDNSGATLDGVTSCGFNTGKDVWFTFDAPTAGDYVVETCGGASFDTVLQAYDVCGGTLIVCNDDACGLQSRITLVGLTPGVPVVIRMASYNNNAGGAGTMTIIAVTPTPPTGVGAQAPAAPNAGDPVLLTVATTPGANPVSTGITVTVDLTNIGGSAGTAFVDDGSNGDVTAGDGTYSYTHTLSGALVDGTYPNAFVVADAESRSSNGTLNVVVVGTPQWDETVDGGADAGDLAASAQIPVGSGSLTNIQGAIGSGDMADMYKIEICDAASFSATTNHPVTDGQDTQLFLFDSAGAGVQMNDDGTGMGLMSAMANEFVSINGTYYIAVSHYDNDPNNATPAEIWLDTPFNTVRAPDGAGMADPVVASWVGTNTAEFSYRIVMTGVCFAPDNCTADFNGDTVIDFFDYLDFVDAFSANDPSADFNGDTVIDFFDYLDFVDAFSVGCP